jgi:dienelactone hydrolase
VRKFILLCALLGSCIMLLSCQAPIRTTVRKGVALDEHVVVNIPGERIEFESTSPISNMDVLEKRGRQDTVAGYLTIPKGLKEKAPVVIIQHCGSGVKDWKDLKYAKALNEWGYATFVVDSWDSRKVEGLSPMSGGTRLIPLVDAYSALKVLSKDPRIDPNRIAVLGWANAAQGILVSQISKVSEIYGDGLHFAAAVAITPVSAGLWWISENVERTPTLILCGEKDMFAPCEHCRQYAELMDKAGGNITVISYPSAGHAWDAKFPPGMYNLLYDTRNCRFLFNVDTYSYELGDGRTISAKSENAMKRTFWYLRKCLVKGGWAGRDDDAALKALEDVRKFLRKHLIEGR